MIECGLPWNKTRELLKFKTSEISAVLCSHGHKDHCRGMAGAVKAGLDVYSSQETFDSLSLSGHRLHSIKSKEAFKVGSWVIMPFDTVHDCPGSLGFLLKSGNEKFLFLTDTAYVKYSFKGINAIAIECNYVPEILYANVENGSVHPAQKDRLLFSHFSLDNVIDFINKNDLADLKEIYLLHLSDGNSDEALIARKISEITNAKVIIA